MIVMQCGDARYGELMRVQKPRLLQWCERIGAELVQIFGRRRPVTEPDRRGFWDKPWNILQLLQGMDSGELLVMVEPDILVADLSAMPQDAIGSAHIALTWRSDLLDSPDYQNQKHFCTGFQIVRACPEMINLFERVWRFGPQDKKGGDCRPTNMVLRGFAASPNLECWPLGYDGAAAADQIKRYLGWDLVPLGLEWNQHVGPVLQDEHYRTAKMLHFSNRHRDVAKRRMEVTMRRLAGDGR